MQRNKIILVCLLSIIISCGESKQEKFKKTIASEEGKEWYSYIVEEESKGWKEIHGPEWYTFHRGYKFFSTYTFSGRGSSKPIKSTSQPIKSGWATY